MVTGHLYYAAYLKKHNRKDIKILAVDFTPEIAKAIREGSINSTCSQRTFTWGSMAIGMLADLENGRSIKKYVDTGTFEVNAANLDIYSNRLELNDSIGKHFATIEQIHERFRHSDFIV